MVHGGGGGGGIKLEKWVRVRLDKGHSGAVSEHGSQDEKIHFLEEGPNLHCRRSLHGFISLSSFHTVGKLCRKWFQLFSEKTVFTENDKALTFSITKL